jgi:uncharacterized membrane protein YfhO
VVHTSTTAAGVLEIDEQYDSDWQVRVDGVPTRTVAIDGTWLGVEMPPGDHVVHFRYTPGWWRPTWIVSLIALGAAMAVVVWPRRRRVASGAADQAADDRVDALHAQPLSGR